MYLGTGWSLVLFSFPIAAKLTPDTYYNQFVPQVQAATKFFTVMTTLMLAAGVVMLVAEPEPVYRWYPIIVLAEIPLQAGADLERDGARVGNGSRVVMRTADCSASRAFRRSSQSMTH